MLSTPRALDVQRGDEVAHRGLAVVTCGGAGPQRRQSRNALVVGKPGDAELWVIGSGAGAGGLDE